LRIGKIAGIEIKIHLLFLLIVGWFFFEGVTRGGAAGAIAALMQLGILFGLVVLHELGHSLVAKHFGYRVLDITLYPIGGAARMAISPRRPIHEILIAASGPAVNIGIAVLLLPLLVLSVPFQGWIPPITSVLGMLFLMNLILALFNLLPAFPMDGGRILRGLLGLWTDPLTATRTAAKVGRVLAIAMGVVGILYPPLIMLVFIAVFVWLAGRAEEISVETQLRWEQMQHATFPSPFPFHRDPRY
jgi:stage IV sporulation protein FB